jgi:phage shock protein PspC (stress-responsive transcriptional regulator)
MKKIEGLTNDFKDYSQAQFFGVCSYVADRFDLSLTRVRNVFIYLSFLSFGSPLVLYLIVAFWLDIKSYIKRKSIIWD